MNPTLEEGPQSKCPCSAHLVMVLGLTEATQRGRSGVKGRCSQMSSAQTSSATIPSVFRPGSCGGHLGAPSCDLGRVFPPEEDVGAACTTLRQVRTQTQAFRCEDSTLDIGCPLLFVQTAQSQVAIPPGRADPRHGTHMEETCLARLQEVGPSRGGGGLIFIEHVV